MDNRERSSGTKLVDNLFSGAPFGMLTSDKGLELKYLNEINKNLDKHREFTERALSQRPSTPPVTVTHRVPEYLPPPEVIIDTSELADAQRDVADALGNVMNAQQDLVAATLEHTPLFKRMISNQGITHMHLNSGNKLSMIANHHLAHGNEMAYQALINAFHQRNELIEVNEEGNELCHRSNQIALAIGAEAFDQRNKMIDQLAQVLVHEEAIITNLKSIDGTIACQIEATREHLHTLLTDIGVKIISMTNDQLITRTAILQSLYRIKSTFMKSHEQNMLTQQHQTGLLRCILEAAEMPDRQKEAKLIWKHSERLRKEGKLDDALQKLQQAYEHDEDNPLIHISLGTIHSIFGNDERAAFSFAEADSRIENHSQLSTYVLMHLSENLHELGRHEHAERVLRKATNVDPTNLEVWFKYGKAAWLAGKRLNAIEVMKRLLAKNPSYYRAQMLIDKNLEDLFSILFPDHHYGK